MFYAGGDAQLFAQHIRRNVLRVFSDASNSVISQQLGDLWRTVPLRLRNQYDDEANRLVKIHQLEFPNYKYQPKKRVPLNSQANSIQNGVYSCLNNNATSCFISGSNSSPVITSTVSHTSVNLLQLTTTTRDIVDCDRIINCPREVDSSRNDLTNRSRLTVSQAPTSSATSQLRANVSIAPTVRVVSPAKAPVRTVYKRLEPKRQNSIFGSAHSGSGATAHSLSSVLPPLLTSSTSCPVSGSMRPISSSTTDPFQIGSCDSAYGSGINSSSSSSASSPAVRDLLSPAKSLASASQSGARSSPIRRKIRPLSQQHSSQQTQQHLTQPGEYPARQRFFSAHSESTSSFNVSRPSIENPTTPDIVYFIPSSCGSSSASPSSSFSSSTSHHSNLDIVDEVHSGVQPIVLTTTTSIQQQLQKHPNQSQGFTPVYVKVDAAASRPNEGLVLAFPPGTTFIQTVGNLGHVQSIPIQSGFGNSNIGSISGGRKVYMTSAGKASPTTSYTVGRNGSGGGSPNQLLQPVKVMSVIGRTVRATDPIHTHPGNHSTLDELSSVTSYSPSSSVYSSTSNDPFIPLHDSQFGTEERLKPELIDEDNQNSKRDVLINNNAIRRRFEARFDTGCMLHTTDPHNSVQRLLSKHQFNMEVEQAPATESVDATSCPSPGASGCPAETTPGVEPNSGSIIDSTAGQTPITEFPMSTEGEQIDTSFDAMMNSVDITTFLPGTFSTDEDQLVVDSNPPKLSSPPGLDSIDEESFDFPQLITYIVLGNLVRHLFSLCRFATNGLDALDKSSLFMIKPDWPIVA
ncbi:unnamed protein product [Echinostoma caproni]|uniref:HMG box domain-containing protein n=1 Tax=Echinostoma caproni TaxID=27848 RepID=A0A183AY70_9TREM|nr:unnamed protein product [Echinostoma caproni]